MAGTSFSFNGYRRNQLVYASVLLLSVAAFVSSFMVQRFKDIPFSGVELDQYNELNKAAYAPLYSNIFLAIFTFFLFTADLFRAKAVPVWVELTWSALAAAMQLANVAVVNQNAPTSHCNPTGSISMTKRDTVADDVASDFTNFQTGPNAEKIMQSASRQICTNWTLMCVFFVVVAIMLLLHISWLVIVAITHRASHPTFLWASETPKPFTWTLAEPSLPAADSASISSESTFNPKKMPTQPSILPTHNEKTTQVQPKIGYYSFAEGKWM